jgi:hypothetical protein
MSCHTRENRDNVPILRPVVSLHDQLMRPRHQCQPIVVIERFRDILSKRVPSSSRRYAPAAPIIRIAPQKIAHRSFVGDFLDSVERSDVVERVDGGAQTAVEAEDLVVDEGREGEVVEEIGEVLPDVRVAVFAQAFVIEAVDLGDLAGLVVAAEDGDSLWEADFESDEEGDGFDRVVASVDVVSCKANGSVRGNRR